RLCSVRAMPVLDPLPDVAMHIVQAPGVRLEFPYWMRRLASVVCKPGILAQLATVVPKTILHIGENHSQTTLSPPLHRRQKPMRAGEAFWHPSTTAGRRRAERLVCFPQEAL